MGTDEKEINSIAELKNILFKKKVKRSYFKVVPLDLKKKATKIINNLCDLVMFNGNWRKKK